MAGRRSTYLESREPKPKGRRRRRLLLLGAVLVPLAAATSVVALPEAGHADTRNPSGVAVLVSCVRTWVAQPTTAFSPGGACVTARDVLNRKLGGAPAPTVTVTASANTPAPAPARTAAASAAPVEAPTTSPRPSATSTATPAPEVSASATPSAAATPPSAVAGTAPAFGSRPDSDAITCTNRTGVTISGRTFRDIRNDTPAISIIGCHDVVIEANDFDGDAEPIYVRDSTNVRIIGNRYRNITGPHERNGSHRGNFTQWENSFGGEIRDNSGIGGDTEDVVSIYKSGGTSAADPLVINGNRFEGTNWTSSSGSGIMLGDGGGSHVVVKDNVLVNVGQVGIGIAGGSDIAVVDNTVYGARRTGSNVGIYAWGQGAGCSGVTVARNRIDFTKENGVDSPLWDGGNCGPVTGWSTNSFPSLDPAALVPQR